MSQSASASLETAPLKFASPSIFPALSSSEEVESSEPSEDDLGELWEEYHEQHLQAEALIQQEILSAPKPEPQLQQVSFQSLFDDYFVLWITDQDELSDLKEMMETMHQVPPPHQHWWAHRKLLKAGSLSQQGVKDGTQLLLTVGTTAPIVTGLSLDFSKIVFPPGPPEPGTHPEIMCDRCQVVGFKGVRHQALHFGFDFCPECYHEIEDHPQFREESFRHRPPPDQQGFHARLTRQLQSKVSLPPKKVSLPGPFVEANESDEEDLYSENEIA